MDMKDTTDTGKKRIWKRGLIAACLALAALAGGGVFYRQTHAVAADADLDAQAQAHLAEQVLAINPDLAFEDLAALSEEELRDLIETGAPGMPIGKDAAGAAAEDWSGTRALNFIWVDVDPALDERTPCYEVALHTAWGNYEYRIDAYTGAVLSGRANVLADAPSGDVRDSESGSVHDRDQDD